MPLRGPGTFDFFFGDGTLGTHTVVGTQTLNADTFYTHLTVPLGTTLVTNGFRLFVSEVLIVDGHIHNDAVGTTPGAGGSLPAGGAAGAGGNVGSGFVGFPGTGTPPGISGFGGVGGGGGHGGASTTPNAPGTGGSSGVPFAAGVVYQPRELFNFSTGLFLGSDLTWHKMQGGSGGGGGGGDAGLGGSNGGDGGAGAGVVLICAREITISATGIVSANGGDGTAGASPLIDGGGGGGGGGLVLLTYAKLTNNGNIQRNGGAAGPEPGAARTPTSQAGFSGQFIPFQV